MAYRIEMYCQNALNIGGQKEVIVLKEKMISRHEIITWLTIDLALVSTAFAASAFRSYTIKGPLNKVLDYKVIERTQELQSSHAALRRMCLDIRC